MTQLGSKAGDEISIKEDSLASYMKNGRMEVPLTKIKIKKKGKKILQYN